MRVFKHLGLTAAAFVLLVGVAAGATLAQRDVTQSHQSQQASVAGFTVVLDASAADSTPVISQQEATNAAVANFAALKPGVSGYVLKASTYHAGVTQILDSQGRRVYSSTDPINGFLQVFTAPPQRGHQWIGAISLINGGTGKVEMSQQFAGDAALF